MNQRIADELSVAVRQVNAAVELLDGGSTVPFIARYRKEATGALDDAQLRTLEERLRYLRELDDRRDAILKEITAQGKLTSELEAQLRAADAKARLEDLYLPYKPKRRTKAQLAREAGLEPLADLLLGDPGRDPQRAAAGFVSEQVPDAAAALDGARAILVERFAEDADLIGPLREAMAARGRLISKVRGGQEQSGAKFADYFEFSEPFARLPAHRVLALFRGEKEEVLDLTFDPGADDAANEARIAHRFGVRDQGRPADGWLAATVHWAWRTRILTHLSIDIRVRLWQAAEDEAVRVFAANVRDLLLAAPAGARATIGLDPGFRTGVKVAVTDDTGKVTATATIYPHEPHRQWDKSLDTLAALARQQHAELIAIGNGTASRETDRLAADLIRRHPDLNLTKVVVSEAGASVYSASAYASGELPELDVSLRGAVSIARRLQDPLAELVKIDPKSIGVGQYQHDVTEGKLSRSLDAVVEDCVNAVGVDLNTASQPLLARVSGITPGLAAAIVARRDAEGPFSDPPAADAGAPARPEGLRAVRRVPAHPRRRRPARRLRRAPRGLPGGPPHPGRHRRPARPADRRRRHAARAEARAVHRRPLRPADRHRHPARAGEARPRPAPGFATATFAEGIETLEDLQPGMVLEGVVTNVAAFGAFVDVGVHQDGLVHVSAMSRSFVSDPRRGQVRRRGAGQGPVRRRAAPPDLAHAPAGRRRGAASAGRRARTEDRSAVTKNPGRTDSGSSGALAEALRRAGLASDNRPR